MKRCSPSTYYAAHTLGDRERTASSLVLGVLSATWSHRWVTSFQDLNDRLRLAEDLALDSLTLMEIVILTEEVLKISISNEELQHLRTLGDIQAFVESKAKGSNCGGANRPIPAFALSPRINP